MTVNAKGKAAEREAALLLHQALQDVIEKPQRNLNQARSGGFDLDGLPGVALEVKRQEKLLITKWWKQTCDQCVKAGLELPVLMYRQNNRPWKFVLPWFILGPTWPVTGTFETDIDGFAMVYRRWLKKVDYSV